MKCEPRFDYYQQLGVLPTATPFEIDRAFKRKAKQFHPDRNSHAAAEFHFKRCNEARTALLDAALRSQHDTWRAEQERRKAQRQRDAQQQTTKPRQSGQGPCPRRGHYDSSRKPNPGSWASDPRVTVGVGLVAAAILLCLFAFLGFGSAQPVPSHPPIADEQTADAVPRIDGDIAVPRARGVVDVGLFFGCRGGELTLLRLLGLYGTGVPSAARCGVRVDDSDDYSSSQEFARSFVQRLMTAGYVNVRFDIFGEGPAADTALAVAEQLRCKVCAFELFF